MLGGGQGGCERKSELLVKIKKNRHFRGGVGSEGGGGRVWVGVVRVDVNEE